MTGHQPTETLLEVLSPPLAASGIDIEGVEISSAGRRQVVRVLVDKDGGVTLDDVAFATTVVNDALDASDVLGDRPYTLEVTSPGVDRPLTAARHWRRNIDRLVAVTMADGSTATGRLIAADDATAVIEVDGTRRDLAYGAVATARVEVEFNRPRPTKEV